MSTSSGLDLSSGASTPGPVDAGRPGAQTPPMPLGKGKNRQRLMRGLQRMSSSSSIASLRRARSHSAPYRSGGTRGALSCVSLTSATPSPGFHPLTPSQLGPNAGNNSSSSSASSPRPATPVTEFPFYDTPAASAAEVDENPRPATSSSANNGSGGTVPVPAGLTRAASTCSSNTAVAATKKEVDSRPPFHLWDELPYELRISVLSFLQPKELVQASRVSRGFYAACLDGQLWTSLDASQFYRDIPAESLARIIVAAGPFVKDLNLRGCVQIEHYKRADAIVRACHNLVDATLEGCRNFQKSTLHRLFEGNERLVRLNLTGLTAVSNRSCRVIAESCPQLRTLNISWCSKVDERGLESLIRGCPRLEDLRVGEVRGLGSPALARAIFQTNRLERLLLPGCTDLTDEALCLMMHGTMDPERDVLTGRPLVPSRRLRHLDLSRCTQLTDEGVQCLGGGTVPDLEGLQLSGCRALTDDALEPVLASTPKLTHLELEELAQLTDELLIDHLAKAPCAPKLCHLSLSYCESLGDHGILPVVQRCVSLHNIDLDNTRASDLVLAEAATMVAKRSLPAAPPPTSERGARMCVPPPPPAPTLHMTVYDCPNVTWTGVREVLYRNSHAYPAAGQPGLVAYPTEAIMLKCYYGFQMTVDEHQKRLLRGDFAAAARLERKWADYMQANEEAGAGGSGHRRRRRRAREAEAMHLDEEGNVGRQRSRTVGSCFVM